LADGIVLGSTFGIKVLLLDGYLISGLKTGEFKLTLSILGLELEFDFLLRVELELELELDLLDLVSDELTILSKSEELSDFGLNTFS
jgi:hypothetical protein